MSKSDSKAGKKSISDAAKIIEKFGGIRPMSAKINVAVTTIQGWKKRDTIPGNRKAVLLRCAAEHKIDLSEFFDDAPTFEEETVNQDADGCDDSEEEVSEGNESPESSEIPENIVATQDVVVDIPSDDTDVEIIVEKSNEEATEEDKVSQDEKDESKENDEVVETPETPPVEKREEFRPQVRASAPNRDFTQIAVTTERRAITKSSVIAAAMVILVIAAIAATLWPDYEEFDARGSRLSDLESEVSDIKKKQTSFKGLVPEDWSKQLEDLKKQVDGAKQVASDTVRVVQDVSGGLIEGPSLEKRVVQLQSYVSEMSGGNNVSALMGRFDSMRSSLNGQKVLAFSSDALGNVFSRDRATVKSDEQINTELHAMRSENPAFAKTFENVPQTELKAAAMLFALTQVRSALNRGDKDFDGDLQLLMNMVGEDDAQLRSSLEKIAPHSKSGLLSGYGLKEEFQTVAGDAVAASLRGEDVSFTEKMSARMNDILKVEKDGEMVSGSDTQKTVDKAEKLIEHNQLEEAVKLLKSHLNDKELAPIRPWLKRAEAVLTSRSVKQAIERAIELNTGAGYLGGEQLLKESRE